MKRAAIYTRVSTDGQTLSNQERELEAAAQRLGWTITERFSDHGISGKNGKEKRPGFNRLHECVTEKRVDVVMAWSVDRLGRSLQHLIGFLNELHEHGVDLYLHLQQIDTTTPGGKMIFQVMGAFSEFERSLIVNRINAGLKRAKAEGKVLGRKRDRDAEAVIMQETKKGKLSATEIAEKAGVTRRAVFIIRKRLRAEGRMK
jgi:DNA invertase Pin-like site-specific DNA recombinase